jgi:hypothetical protein
MVLLRCWLAMPSGTRARADDNVVERSRVDPAGYDGYRIDPPACERVSDTTRSGSQHGNRSV